MQLLLCNFWVSWVWWVKNCLSRISSSSWFFDPGFRIPTVVYICNTSYIFIWTLNFNQPLIKTAKGIRIKEPSSETCDTIKRGRWFIWFWNAALAASETSSTSRRLRLVISSVKNYVTSNYPNLFFLGCLCAKQQSCTSYWKVPIYGWIPRSTRSQFCFTGNLSCWFCMVYVLKLHFFIMWDFQFGIPDSFGKKKKKLDQLIKDNTFSPLCSHQWWEAQYILASTWIIQDDVWYKYNKRWKKSIFLVMGEISIAFKFEWFHKVSWPSLSLVIFCNYN